MLFFLASHFFTMDIVRCPVSYILTPESYPLALSP